jgi:DNA-binding transcriptional regulator YdaS (Cro superfamily)
MNLQAYFETESGARKALADALGTSPDYLWQIATNWNGRQASPKLAARIEEATNGAVTRADLRPDLWSDEPKPRREAA